MDSMNVHPDQGETEASNEQLEEVATSEPINRFRNYANKHPFGTALVLLIGLAFVGLLAIAGVNASNLPEIDQVEQDARERLNTPDFEQSIWAAEQHFVLSDLEVVSRSRSSSAPKGSDLSVTFGAQAYANADIIAHYNGNGIKATKSTTLGYARQNDQWLAAGSEQDVRVAFEASKGVDIDAVVENAQTILGLAEQRASQSAGTSASTPQGQNEQASNEDLSLAKLYSDAKVSVKSEVFDEAAQEDVVVLRFVQQEGFSSYECDVTCTFNFHAINGAWELVDASVSEGALIRTFTPIIGAWKGNFQTQSTQGTKCLAASAHPLEINIRSYTSDTTGTHVLAEVTGVAHYHEHPEKDADSDKDDVVFENVEIPLLYKTTPLQLIKGSVVFEGSLPETTGGTVTIAIAFGNENDPSAVTCVVHTEHSFDSSFIVIPFEDTAVWNDTYVLTRTK